MGYTYRDHFLPKDCRPLPPKVSPEEKAAWEKRLEAAKEAIDTRIRRRRWWFRFVRWLLKLQERRRERGLLA
ncbi:MAG: hypothetical protein F4Y26_00520 [Gammaproteobacteria bacterium]|nr:hypothetical protein [Gammaproteobacteria bacterium]